MRARIWTPEPKQINVIESVNHKLLFGDALKLLRNVPDNSFDSIVTDGPYGLEFMGEEWDSFGSSGAGVEKDAKSAGGYGKNSPTNENAFAAVRVRHGNLSKQRWTERPAKVKRRADGHNRATDGVLPVYTGGMAFQLWNRAWAEEALRVLKPGGYLLNFGGTRTHHRMVCGIEDAGAEIRDQIDWIYGTGFPKGTSGNKEKSLHTALKPGHECICVARKPLSEKTVKRNIEVWGTGAFNINPCRIEGERWPANVVFGHSPQCTDAECWWDCPILELGPASKFFYCCKPPKKEKDAGLDSLDEKLWVQWQTANGTSGKASSISAGRNTQRRNTHPTIKPVELMRYLLRLVTPVGGSTLDLFMGSATTGVAALQEGFYFTGIEGNREFFAIAALRCLYAESQALALRPRPKLRARVLRR